MNRLPEIVVQRVPCELVRPIRHAVLRAGKPYETTRFPGDELAETVHFGAFVDGAMAGVASLYHESPAVELLASAGVLGESVFAGERTLYWRLRGMAVLPEWRRHRLGTELLRAVEGEVARHGPGILWFTARTGALVFYLRHGYVVMGREFDLPGIGPHYLGLKEM